MGRVTFTLPQSAVAEPLGCGVLRQEIGSRGDREVGSDRVRCGVDCEASQGEGVGDAFNIKSFEFSPYSEK